MTPDAGPPGPGEGGSAGGASLRVRRSEGDAPPRDPAVTVGFFDGVHRGHRRLIASLRAWADETGGEAWVITFRDHPAAVLRGVRTTLIMNLRQRIRAILREGADGILLLDFDRDLAALEPEAFVDRFVREELGGRRLLLGFNTAIGRDRKGTYAYLQGRSTALGIAVRAAPPVLLADGTPVSSTAVRRAIVEGRLDEAEGMLGRPVSLFGRVVCGDARGRALGFPTANLDLAHAAVPPVGVYTARAEIGGVSYPALVSIGSKTTFTRVPSAGLPYREERDSVEVHLAGYEGDLYGSEFEVEILRRLRDVIAFPGAEELVRQMREDLRILLAEDPRRAP
ncbi:MAG: riboflavin biosynthesis protein RibF [Planctomycetes bacterium]|nr:riboflavin biosynthesis protein RibF [Planctomycetota bacterium]